MYKRQGNKYLSERFDWEIGMLSEEMPESVDSHSIPEVKMKARFMNEIKCCLLYTSRCV